MKITKKRVFIGCGALLGLTVITVGIMAAIYWNELMIMLENREVQGEIEAVPEPAKADLPPLTRGKADWICWRGPKADGKALVTGIRTDWTGGLRKEWEISYLCQGRSAGTWSAPVVKGNRLVVSGRDGDKDLVFCLSPEDGSLIWKTSYEAKADSGYGTGARATPWIDGDKVYTFGRAGDLACWQLLDGLEVWRINVSKAGGEPSRWGHSTSPLVTDTSIIVGGGGQALTASYDKHTGELQWKTGTGPAGYAALVKTSIASLPVVLAFHGKGLAALALKDGRQLWDTPWETSYDVNATTPVVDGDLVFITSGYGTGCQALRMTADQISEVWRSKVIASQHSDPYLLDGKLYMYSGDSTQNKGHFRCVELGTGKELWSTAEMGWGTCVAVEDYLLCCDIKGNLFLCRPRPDRFELVTSQPQALGKIRGASWTVPVLANGRLYLRFVQRLLCFDISAVKG